jgi:hypothetical protein
MPNFRDELVEGAKDDGVRTAAPAKGL